MSILNFENLKHLTLNVLSDYPLTVQIVRWISWRNHTLAILHRQ